ncbi:MAG TPA: DMT family transporter [Terriglobales bacterium]|nr:DMT family transporter [Terriglobales bacterium]
MSRPRGMLLVAGAATVWSSGGLIARLVDTDAWTTTFWRGLCAAAFLIVVIAVTRRQGPLAQWRAIGLPGAAVALCLATASTCFILALTRTSVANTLILMSVGPWVAGLLGWFVLGERVRPRTWTTMGLALAGVAIMVSASHGTSRLAGDALAILMATVFAVGTVLMRRHPEIQMAPAAGLGAALTCVIGLALGSPGSASARDVALLAFFGAGQLGVGFLMFTAGARLIPVAESSLIGMLETVLGPFWVWLFLGETIGVRTVVGGAVILAALVAHTLLDVRATVRASRRS